MTKEEFSIARKKLEKTQKKMAELLGTSLKTIHSYEQGWRTIPAHIERQIFFLLINRRGNKNTLIPCWERKLCTVKEECPAWEFQSGHLCWFICGTKCDCTQGVSQRDKIAICKKCDILANLLK